MNAPTTLTQMFDGLRSLDRTLTYIEGEDRERALPFATLHARALGLLHHLQAMGAAPGDTLVLFLNDNEQFVDAFWAAILGGIVPVPVAVGISDEHRRKLLRIARQLGRPFLYTDRKAYERISQFSAQAPGAEPFPVPRERVFLADQVDDVSRPGRPRVASPSDLAFIQFSSGSTSDPKGVQLTHGNVMANTLGAIRAARLRPDDVSLSWMPLTHDMGLIGLHIFMLTAGMHVVQMPTDLFVRRPLLWMQAASRKRATVLCSPNFGYRHYLKVLGERALDGLDLSAVRIIFNGAEPISASLCEEFLERLRPARLPREAMYPVYGLAEASVAVSFPEPGSALRMLSLDRHRLGVGEPAQRVPRASRDALTLVGVGRAIPNCELRIAADDDAPLPPGHIGHIQIRGGNVTDGYFANPAASAALKTADGWTRTGDLGLVDEDALFITGRAKEILFVNGQNYYPYDLEAIAIAAEGMDLGKLVVAGVRPPDADTDRLVVFVLHRRPVAEFAPLAAQVARLINEHTGLEVAEVVPVGRIPKTTSGKVQRHLLEEAYLAGEFDSALAELRALRSAGAAGAVPAASEIEARLRSICDAAFGGRPIGVGDNLFELGASSLKLIELHEQLDQAWPGAVDLTELFDHPTIAQLARFIESRLAARRA
ncbi:MAG: non-ribosomal peptide synthetase [Steroidobacteraceae bacterium]|jgi:acyl-CoA synthetase (AMP-forming)/AMP-acid ligase II/aryl carrier-like protein|nr:non-ribosomal peptide synthetase [Steroidobacteraceae bacterium]